MNNLKHRRKSNGQCYAACPVCVEEGRQTGQIVKEIFAELGFRNAFMMGFCYGIGSLRQPRETYEKMAQSLPPLFRDLALKFPDAAGEAQRRSEPRPDATAMPAHDGITPCS